MPTLLRKSKVEKPAPEAPTRMEDDPTVRDLRERLAARKAEKADLEQRLAVERNRPKPSDVDAVVSGGLAAIADVSLVERLVDQARTLDSAVAKIKRDLDAAEREATDAAVAATMPQFYEVLNDFFDHLESAKGDLAEIVELTADLHKRGFARAQLPRPHGIGHVDGHFAARVFEYLGRLDFDELRKANAPGRELPWARQPLGNPAQIFVSGHSVPQVEEPRSPFRFNWS